MYIYIPDRSNICIRCRNPSLTTCSACNTSFLCERNDGGRCQVPIIPNRYNDKKVLYIFLKMMGSGKVKSPCPWHINCGTEDISRDSIIVSLNSSIKEDISRDSIKEENISRDSIIDSLNSSIREEEITNMGD